MKNKNTDYVYYALEQAYKEKKKQPMRERYNRYCEIIKVCPEKYLIQSISYMNKLNSIDNGNGEYFSLFSLLITCFSVLIAIITSVFAVFVALKEESSNKEEFVKMLINNLNTFYQRSTFAVIFILIFLGIVSILFIWLKKWIENRKSRRIYFITIIEEYLNNK